MTKIKLCGIRRKEDIDIVNLVKPDYIGYVFAKASRRYIEPEKARELTDMLDSDIIPVGVFVNEPLENVAALVKNGTIKAVQLHGSEDEEYIAGLQSRGILVIRAFKINGAADIEKAKKSRADYILLDSGSGSGKAFEWFVIGDIDRDYFLAGGLDSSNVSLAIKTLHPYAVDASSCLEKDGVKDLDKTREFVREAILAQSSKLKA